MTKSAYEVLYRQSRHGLLFVFIFTLSTALYSIYEGYQGDVDAAKVSASHLASALAEHADHLFSVTEGEVNLLARDIKERIKNKKPVHLDIGSRLSHLRNSLSFFESFGFSDKHGNIVLSSRNRQDSITPKAHINIRDREYFQFHARKKAPEFYIGEIIFSKRTETPILPCSMGVYGDNGEFLGVISINIDPNYFSDFYKSFARYGEHSFTLMAASGRILFRYPESILEIQMIQKKLIPPELRKLASQHEPSLPSSFSLEKSHLTSFNSAKNSPVIVSVATNYKNVLGSWQRSTILNLCLLTFMLSCFYILSKSFQSHLGKLALHEGEQKEAEETIKSLLTETAAKTGNEYLQTLVVAASRTLPFKHVVLIEFDPEDSHPLRTRAYAIEGHLQDSSHPLMEDTAKIVIGKTMQFYPSRVAELLPKYPFFSENNIQSFVGIPIFDSQKRPFGALMAFDQNAIKESQNINSILTVFSVRAGAEMERIKFEQFQTDAIEREKLAERQMLQAQKIEAVGTLAGGMAHDFNNILTAIFGNLEMAFMRLEPSHPAYKHLEKIQSASERAKSLTKQILQFSRRQDPMTAVISVNSMLTEVYELMRAVVPTNINFVLDLPKEELFINADPNQIHQVLVNLCTNAWHAMENKAGTLVLSTWAANGQAKISVKDTGCGMSEELQKQIFQPFFTTKEGGKGTGLGLAVVQNIVERHHGEIDLFSQENVGTEFVISLALENPVEETMSLPQASPLKNVHHLKPIMVVDDESDLTMILKEFLSSYGFEVQAFTKPEEALFVFQKDPHAFSLIITDMTMPKLSGDELIEKIKEQNLDIPIIIISGYNPNIETALARYTYTTYVQKPFDFDEFVRILQQLLNYRYDFTKSA